MMLTEHLSDDEPEAEAEIATEAAADPLMPIILEDLQNLVFKLRAFTEADGGDFAFGVETGMERAAAMIENVIRRHTGEDRIVG